MKNKVYVLHGYWNSEFGDGVKIIKISNNFDTVYESLRHIIETQASDYIDFGLNINYCDIEESDREYEIIASYNGNLYAKFYITEEEICN